MAFAAGAILVLGMSACAPKADTAAPPAQVVDWPAFVQSFITSDFTFNPDFAIYEGKHDFDGKLPDWSEDGLQKQIASLKDWKNRAQAIDPAKLTKAQAFERDYLIAVIDGKLFWLETADWPHKNPAFYGLDPNVYVARPYADVTTRMKAFTQYALARPQGGRADQGQPENAPAPQLYRQRRCDLQRPCRLHEDGRASRLQGWRRRRHSRLSTTAAAGAAAAFTSLAKWLEDQRKTQTEGFAMGPDLFSKMLYETERVDTPLDELEAIGRADLKRNQDALAEACKTFAPGKSIKDCVAKEAADKPEGGVVEYARKQLVDLKQFVIDHNVATVPGARKAKAEAIAALQPRRTRPTSIRPGRTTRTCRPSITSRRRTRPGRKQSSRPTSPARPTCCSRRCMKCGPATSCNSCIRTASNSIFGQIYVGYAFAEGWAHYAEEMMWEEGLGDGDPETHVGQLLNALLRNVRFLSAIGMHTKGMTHGRKREDVPGGRLSGSPATPSSRRRAAPMIPPISTTRWAS